MSDTSPIAEELTEKHLTNLELSNLKAQNDKRGVNRLPPELLARIFILGDEGQRASRKSGVRYYGLQDLAVRVCAHWRSVATNNPTLWTYIYVSRPAPHHSAALYITRSRPIALLDIHLNLEESPYDRYDHWPLEISRLENTIQFLAQKGASVSRWKSLTVLARVPQVLYKIVDYICSESSPALRFLSLKWRVRTRGLLGSSTMDNENESLAYLSALNKDISLSSCLPQLLTVRFTAAPSGFVFSRLVPMFVGLARLKLKSACSLFPLPELHTLLSANPQLQSLHLGTSFSGCDYNKTKCRVSLSSLRSLVLTWTSWEKTHVAWARAVMGMIDCPAIEHLELDAIGVYNDQLIQLTDQILAYVSESDSTSSYAYPDQTTSDEPIYPVLRSLQMSKLKPNDDCTEGFRDLLSALPTITTLAAPREVLELLANDPQLLPRLERFKFAGRLPEDLSSTLCRIVDGGSTLNTLEVQLSDICASEYDSDERWSSADDNSEEEETDVTGFSEDESSEALGYCGFYDTDSEEAAMESAWQRYHAELNSEGEEHEDEDEFGDDEGYDDEEEGGSVCSDNEEYDDEE
ncbi:hypothetical protein FRC12_014900 [Ceratobasidium sp. 428]|nr:hypothetical protein FRC12_014900 [Ceratobasidium sp. 428]